MEAIHSDNADEMISLPTPATEPDTNANNESYPRTSDIFNATDAEIRFQSSDGVIFHIHKINLNACTEGFSPPEHCTFHELVPLSEQSRILDILFQFIYPQPQPDLTTLAFDDLLMLAEAAEKYLVYPAMNLCTVHLGKHLPAHDEEILAHGLRHTIYKLIDDAAPLVLQRPLEDVLLKLGDPYSSPWVRYHLQWVQVSRESLSHLETLHNVDSDACAKCIVKVTSDLNSRIATLENLDSFFVFPERVFGHHGCKDTHFMKAWRELLETAMKKGPNLTGIIFPREQERPCNNSGSDSQNGMPNSRPTDISATHQEGSVKVTSNDGVVYYLDPEGVRVCAKGLLRPEHEEPIAIPFHSTALTLLAQFIQRSPHPDLATADIMTLLQIYEAASTYNVFAAITLCKMRLKNAFVQQETLKSHAAVVMKCALNVKDYELIDKAAPPLVAQLSLADATKLMGLSTSIKWGMYCAQWDDTSRRAFSFATRRKVSHFTKYLGQKAKPVPMRGCTFCKDVDADSLTIEILCKLSAGAASLQNLDHTFSGYSGSCIFCIDDIRSWRQEVMTAIQKITKFSVFLMEAAETDLVSST